VNGRPRPRALITNDDGIDAEGLRQLALAALDAGLDPVIAAPLIDSSGIGAGLRGVEDHGRILVERRSLAGLDGITAYGVAASPAYIVLLAARGAFGAAPDVVLSGINHGANTGRAVLHSGTAGAALTAIADGFRAMAFSIDLGFRDPAKPHWETATAVATQLLGMAMTIPAASMLNVNVPNLPLAQVRGIRRAPLDGFGAVQMTLHERGEGYVRMTLEQAEGSVDPESDDGLILAGYVTVTPLRPIAAATDVPMDDLPARVEAGRGPAGRSTGAHVPLRNV
jgi:5'-nucleotidase